MVCDHRVWTRYLDAATLKQFSRCESCGVVFEVESYRGDWREKAVPVPLFVGAPDARQQPEIDAPVSRFRPRYRALTPEELALHDDIQGKADELAVLFDRVKAGRYRSLGMTALEEAVMWTVKELTS